MKKFKLFSFLIIFLATQLFFSTKISQAAGASLYLTPSSKTYVLGNSFSVGVKVNSGGVEMNAAEGTINFDNTLLEVTAVSNGGSIFPFWTVMPTGAGAANSSGAVKFGGGMSPPFYKGTAGHIITISFKTKKAGTAQVRFSSGAVLANDGKGTNILASMGSASFVISPKVEAPTPSKTETKKEEVKKEETKKTEVKKEETKKEETEIKEEKEEEVVKDYNTPLIKSETHSDPNKWSNKNDVKFSWDLPAGIVGVSVSFNEKPVDNPGDKSDGNLSEKEFNDVADGVWYLHLKFKDSKKWGTVAHYRVMIDTRAPEPFELNVREIEVGDWPILEFETKDGASGIVQYEIFVGSLEEKNYTIAASSKDKEKKSLKLENLNVGSHTAIVRAIDSAGNETLSTIKFEVKPIASPEIKNFSQEIGSSDKFFMSGSSVGDSQVNIYLQKDDVLIASSSIDSKNGEWFYVHPNNLEKGRYVAWAEAVNSKGIKSNLSPRVTFLVSPPVFALIGDYIIDYFTVFVSLLFVIVLIIALIVFVVTMIRKKLKKETIEIESVLHKYLQDLKNEIEKDFSDLKKYEGKVTYSKQKLAMKNNLLGKVDEAEVKILKEVRDVEKILK